MTVQEFHDKLEATLNAHEQGARQSDHTWITTILKGTKVRTIYQTRSDNVATEDRRIRVIKDVMNINPSVLKI